MDAWILLIVVAGYIALLFLISQRTSRKADNESFFSANRSSRWYLVAFGMIGTTLSGVTFISIPGAIGAGGGNANFSYLQTCLGYIVGYGVVAFVLLPLYYKHNLLTIYTYLKERLGTRSHKTGAVFFLLSRMVGASFRLYLVSMVLDVFVLGPLGVPFAVTVASTIALIWLYTYRGGIQTVVWTDTLQTFAMLAAVVLVIFAMGSEMTSASGESLGVGGLVAQVLDSGYSQMFYFDGGWQDPNNFFKMFFFGAFLAIVMTGLDQDMMQKNLTCRNLPEAQKNMTVFSGVLFLVNVMFVFFGAMLYLFAQHIGIEIPAKSDTLFPIIALEHLSPAIGIVFIVGLIAAAYSSADSALTALTTSFCVDILDITDSPKSEAQKSKTRIWVHLSFSVLLFFMIVAFHQIANDAVINSLFRIAGYTYGPLLGLFAYGMFTSWKVKDMWVPLICVLAPIVCYVLNAKSAEWFWGYTFGFELLIVNGLLTFLGLWLVKEEG